MHILYGDLKIGKSCMMMDMCIAVSKGEDLIDRKTEQRYASYMALRIHLLICGRECINLPMNPSENLTFSLIANSISSGLEKDLREYKKMSPDLKMVIIITLKKSRTQSILSTALIIEICPFIKVS